MATNNTQQTLTALLTWTDYKTSSWLAKPFKHGLKNYIKHQRRHDRIGQGPQVRNISAGVIY